MEELFFIFDPKDPSQSRCGQRPQAYHEDGQVTVAILGHLYDREHRRLDARQVGQLYAQQGEAVTRSFEGVHTVLIADLRRGQVLVFRDGYGSNQQIFFYDDGARIAISNSMKRILAMKDGGWETDPRGARSFLARGYCLGSDTLIRQIRKIPGKRYLKLSASGKRIDLRKYPKEPAYTGPVSDEAYDRLFGQIVTACTKEDTAATISKGYDSNFILYQLQKSAPASVDCYCIGGKAGANEIPDAEKIAAHYGNVRLHTRYVDGDTLEHLPQIMYALDFSLYECGIFLQYTLCSLLRDHGVEHILLGECADQVLNYCSYHPAYQLWRGFCYRAKRTVLTALKGIRFGPFRPAYEMGADLIIKKNGILANYFGIRPEYRYLHKDYIAYARRVVIPGKENKRYHKEAVSRLLPDPVAAVLKKMPGTTDGKDLFTGRITMEKVRQLCKTSPYYKDLRFAAHNDQTDYLMKVLCLELLRIMYLEQPQKYLAETWPGDKLTDIFPELV